MRICMLKNNSKKTENDCSVKRRMSVWVERGVIWVKWVTVSLYYHAGSKSVLPTHGSPMMPTWWPTSSSEGVTVCDDKQWRTKQILFTSLFLTLFQNLMSCLLPTQAAAFYDSRLKLDWSWVIFSTFQEFIQIAVCICSYWVIQRLISI